MPTTNMSLNEPSVGQTAGPTWATEVNENFTTIDQHDHTSGKGVQLTPSALNINSDLEFNGNAAIELKRLTLDSSATGSGTNYSVYQSGGNLYWYNGSGQAVQITNGANVKTTGGSIDGMDSTDAGADYGSGYFKWEFDTTKTPFAGAKMKNADIELHKYDGASGSNAYVILKYTGSSEGSNNLTFPDETGTLLSTATSFGGAINIDATGGSGSITLDAATSVSIEADTTITLDAEGDINLDSNSGVLTFKDNGTAIGKISNSSSDLVIENEVDAKDIIFKQYDGNEVVRMADDRRLYFFDKGGEYIVGDGTDLTVASGGAINLTATTDVVVPTNVGITFGTGEKIEGDNTDLTLTSGADINLTATADVNLPVNVGLVFGDGGEKIESDNTDLTITSGVAINLNAGVLDLSAQTVDVTLNGAVDALNFDSNTLSIDASNNRIGIGTAAPASTLSVHSTGQAIVRVDGVDQYYTGVKIRNNHSSTQTDWNIGSAGGSSGWGSTNGNFLIRDDTTNSTGLEIEQGAGSNTPAVMIDSSGNVKINDGNLVIGTGGHGIDFSEQTAAGSDATTKSELLDHYEFGQWNPTDIDGSTNHTPTSRAGFYTRIGNQVIIKCRLSGFNSASSTQSLVVGNLPFTSGPGQDNAIAGVATCNEHDFGAGIVGIINANAVTMYFIDVGTGDASNTVMKFSNLYSTGATLQLTAQYQTDYT